MLITIVGPGRAGLSLAAAAGRAGHDITAVVARTAERAGEAALALGAAPYAIGDPLPPSDLCVVSVRDDAIESVAGQLAAAAVGSDAAVHLSGLAPVAALEPLAAAGVSTGSFHPLQTLPTPAAGAAALAGSWIAITASRPRLYERLTGLAESLGALPFSLSDEHKAVYHAAAAAAANFPLAALTMASDLFDAAGVPFEAAHPLVDAVVANAFDLGPRAALTGPVARGDVATVAAQLAAVRAETPSLVPGFVGFVRELARLIVGGVGEA